MKGSHDAFMPAHLKQWKPRAITHRRCHWCSGERQHVSTMVQVLEAPMRFFFCGDACLTRWQRHRHDADVVEWLRECVGDRHKILKRVRNEEPTDARKSSATLRDMDHLQMPVRTARELPQGTLSSECRGSQCDCTV